MKNSIKHPKVQVYPGDRVCLTKIAGNNQEYIKDGRQYIGYVSQNGIRKGDNLIILNQIETSVVTKLFHSYTSILIKTRNSLYLLEKLR